MHENGSLALAYGWFDDSIWSGVSTIGTGWDNNVVTTYYQPWTYMWPAKITLKLSEVEHLRKLAKSDAKLRGTLKKFAPFIEVEVDFPG